MEASQQSLFCALGSSTRTVQPPRRRSLDNHAGARRRKPAVERARQAGRVLGRTRAPPMNLSKKKVVLLDGSGKPDQSGFATRVRALRRLLPSGGSVVGLDDLFIDAADYITCLQMQVSVMQAMVDVLSSSES